MDAGWGVRVVGWMSGVQAFPAREGGAGGREATAISTCQAGGLTPLMPHLSCRHHNNQLALVRIRAGDCTAQVRA